MNDTSTRLGFQTELFPSFRLKGKKEETTENILARPGDLLTQNSDQIG